MLDGSEKVRALRSFLKCEAADSTAFVGTVCRLIMFNTGGGI